MILKKAIAYTILTLSILGILGVIIMIDSWIITLILVWIGLYLLRRYYLWHFRSLRDEVDLTDQRGRLLAKKYNKRIDFLNGYIWRHLNPRK